MRLQSHSRNKQKQSSIVFLLSLLMLVFLLIFMAKCLVCPICWFEFSLSSSIKQVNDLQSLKQKALNCSTFHCGSSKVNALSSFLLPLTPCVCLSFVNSVDLLIFPLAPLVPLVLWVCLSSESIFACDSFSDAGKLLNRKVAWFGPGQTWHDWIGFD